MTHEEVWRTLDRLAARMGLSPSALARLAGLDPTSFNPSKRITPQGRPRWLGTESLAKVLLAAGLDLEAFGRLMKTPDEGGHRVRPPPARPVSRASGPGFLYDGSDAPRTPPRA